MTEIKAASDTQICANYSILKVFKLFILDFVNVSITFQITALYYSEKKALDLVRQECRGKRHVLSDDA